MSWLRPYKYDARAELNLLLSTEDTHEAVIMSYMLDRLSRQNQVGVGARGGRFAPLGVCHHRDRPEEGGEVLASRAAGERLVHAGGAGLVLCEETLGPPLSLGIPSHNGVDIDGVLRQQPPHRLRDGCEIGRAHV